MGLINTSLFSLNPTTDDEVKTTLKSVAKALTKEGYQPVEQIVGYLVTGDPIYITSKHEARNQMRKLDRDKVLQILVKDYLK